MCREIKVGRSVWSNQCTLQSGMAPRDACRDFNFSWVLLFVVIVIIATDLKFFREREDSTCESREFTLSDRGNCNKDFLTPELDGRWVRDPDNETHVFAAPTLCSWDKGAFKKNPKDCGNWSMLPIYSVFWGRNDSKLVHMGGNANQCGNFSDRYMWESKGVHQSEWNATTTCRLLGKRRVLMIGDSTMQQAAATLMNAVFPAKCQTHMAFSLGDTLFGKVSVGKSARGRSWIDVVADVKPEIVVIGAGAHIRGRLNYTLLIDAVLSEIKALSEWMPNVKVIWRTIHPAGCTAEPELTVSPLQAARQWNWDAYPQKYVLWDEFYSRDLETISKLQHLGIPFIDMRMLYSRSDAHSLGDCLHACAPGPLDLFAVLFQKLLESDFAVSPCVPT